MLIRTLFAEVDIISPGEITFLKFLGILLMFLWVAYLLKELFFSHRRDPMMDSLSTAVSSMTTAIASNSARMEMLEKRQNERITQQRQDTGLIFLAQSAGAILLLSLGHALSQLQNHLPLILRKLF